jgi:hypothetical protein
MCARLRGANLHAVGDIGYDGWKKFAVPVQTAAVESTTTTPFIEVRPHTHTHMRGYMHIHTDA